MTTLNTIIEEEKKEFDDTFPNLAEYVPAYWGEPDEKGISIARSSQTIDRKLKVIDFLTTAMQRAYEARGAEIVEMVEAEKENWGWDETTKDVLDTILSKITHKTPHHD